MSLDISSERVCYVHCNLCNTILAVGIPYSNLYNIVTVRCGHCANLLSVNIGHLQHEISLPFHDFQNFNHIFQDNGRDIYGSSSKNNRFLPFESALDQINQPRMLPIRPQEIKRQRVPSAYNKFIKEEIQRIKASNPDISHREAFSTAAKNWAHFPHIRFGLNLEAAKQRAIVDEAAFMGSEAPQIKARGRL